MDTLSWQVLNLEVPRIDGGDPDFVFAALDLGNPEAEDATYDYMQDRTGDAGLFFWGMLRCPWPSLRFATSSLSVLRRCIHIVPLLQS